MKLNILTLLFFVTVGFLIGVMARDIFLIHEIKADGKIQLDGFFNARCFEKVGKV